MRLGIGLGWVIVAGFGSARRADSVVDGVEDGAGATLADWRRADGYRYLNAVDGPGWAWEFLRRNQGYCADWDWFNPTWQALEADYGAPPHRDFHRWRQDPRAWRDDEFSVADPSPADGACGVPGERLLIECWMGAKWGFYGFPPDPVLSAAELSEPIKWRPYPGDPVLLERDDERYFEPGSSKTALGFDLALPLDEQLRAARRMLIVLQRRRCRQAPTFMRTVDNRRERWALCLRLLDGQRAGATEAELEAQLCASRSAGDMGLAALRRQADALVQGAYRALADLH